MQGKIETQVEDVLEYSSVIVGSGPVGLLSTLAALKHASSTDVVALLADRRDELGVREQVLWIQQDVYDFIEGLVGKELMTQYRSELAITEDGDYDEDNPLKPHGYFITTGDLERLAYAALTEQYEEGVDYDIIDTKKIAAHEDSADVIKINKREKTILVKAEGMNGERDGKVHNIALKFNNLVAADGAKRSIAKALGEEELIFDETQKPLQHKRHVVATFKIPEGTTPRACSVLKVRASEDTGVPEPVVMAPTKKAPERIIKPCSMGTLREYGWKGNTRPYSQVFATRDVIYIGVEMPSELPKEKAQEYAKLMMLDQLPADYLEGITEIECDMRTAYGKKKALLKTSVFDLELGDLNKTLIPCGDLSDEEDIGAIFFMGDARKNPLYTTGSGAQTGIREVRNFEQFLIDRQSATHGIAHDLEKFHAHSRALLDAIVEKQNTWIGGRVAKEQEACANLRDFKTYKAHILKVKDFVDAFLSEASEVEDSPFVNYLKTDLLGLKSNHKKLFACCNGESDITCYTGINVSKFLTAIEAIRINVYNKYPSLAKILDATPTGAHDFVSDFYNNLNPIMRDISKPTVTEIGFFASETRSSAPITLVKTSEVENGTKVNNLS
ncbi:hypothetical protein [Legionella sp. km772]|uniref:hypothetical protein n=1 Tax=Legionella sp. km772 TaxID=2498111 RepID=UPI000F8F7EF6|nr:hypothetical protein [Legionella sp. km772]RUR12796.1 hypothetical protein ELY15_03940 [Legionella sp. km772]